MTLLRQDERRALAERGLQPVHLQVLDYLTRCNRYSDMPAAVADWLDTSRSQVSKCLEVLEEHGLVRASFDERDRTLVHLLPTTKGRRLLGELRPPTLLRRGVRSVADDVDLEAAVADLLRGMQRARPGRAFGLCQTCRYHLRAAEGDWTVCGLTRERLSGDDRDRLCREHAEVVARARR